MQIEGITWHGLTLEPDQFVATNKLCRDCLRPHAADRTGWLDAARDAERHHARPL